MDPIDTPASSEELLVRVELRLHMADTAPHSIKQLGHQVRTALVYMLELIFLYLSLCTGHSKAIRVMSEMHRDWAKNSGLVGYDSDSDSGSDSAGKTGSERMKKDLPKSPKPSCQPRRKSRSHMHVTIAPPVTRWKVHGAPVEGVEGSRNGLE
ncbi:hypothetical protein B0H14DRAFT_3424903 [Mycena olivaceomarginata]|nr:hypothetical protein B0H14DRAFT_3424903 [Mycena olivaceomarginata]